MLRAAAAAFARSASRTTLRAASMASSAPKPGSSELLRDLRGLMRERALAAYIVPTADAHQSEYVRDCDKRREFLTGFTGSAGTAVVTLEKALLWTDGRYYAQAAQELSEEWTLMKDRLPETPSIEEWLSTNLEAGATVGVDGFLYPYAAAKRMLQKLGGGHTRDKEGAPPTPGVKLVDVQPNLVDTLWTTRPSPPGRPLLVHDMKFAGMDVPEKLELIREDMRGSRAEALLVTALDEVAWLLNLRGSEVECNPVAVWYAVVTHDAATLFVDPAQATDEVRAHLAAASVELRPYDDILTEVQRLAEAGKRVWADPVFCNYTLYQALRREQVIEERSPVQMRKAIKNEVEIEGFRQCHLHDGAALVEYFAWLEEEVVRKGSRVTEVQGADHLERLRATRPHFFSLSFPTISSCGPNGAIIHYRPRPETCADIERNNVYLCDSGGQYFTGTTDVTRTLWLGEEEPPEHVRRCFTRVLQGHIDLAMAVFPEGTSGILLDPLARVPLWTEGLDYLHGTGHGVGSFLNVHEGPHGINSRPGPHQIPLQPGMTVTDEPGYYEDGKFGIRVENVLIVKEASTPFRFNDRRYFCFENVTMAPVQRRMLLPSLLTAPQLRWLNDYHREVRAKLAPLVAEEAREYLLRETEPVEA